MGTAPGLRYQSGGTGNAGRTLRITGGGSVVLGDTGTDRFSFNVSGFTCATDNTYDIGASGANRPRNLYLAGAVATKIKAGAPVDGDFTNPVDGMIAVDSTNNKLWARVGGAWKGVAIA